MGNGIDIEEETIPMMGSVPLRHRPLAHLEGSPDMLAGYFGIGEEGLAAKAVTDSHAAVAVDVATRKRDPRPARELAGFWTRL